MEIASTILKYFDLFGTRCTFYSDKMPKLYTVTGGIFSILSIISFIFIFILFSLDDIKRRFPITTTSFIPSEGYKKIKFGKEKIWIPWRIVDYKNNEYVNHTGILYPIIYYHTGIKDKRTRKFNLTTKILNYKLCSETSMIEETNFFTISVPLNEIYCIDMEELEMGGSWITEFINYIQFDIYYCEDGIEYDEANSKCSSFNEITNFIGENNSLEFDLYYPVVQFQPTNKTNPLIIIYQQHFYHLSKYVNKIERLYLQENVLNDDLGYILKRETNYSYLGLNIINGETYFNGKERDIINEGSNSRAYSLNLYLEPGIILYKRHYKKLYIIFSDFFPFGYIIFIFIKNISKLIKKVESNKKMVELLFENLQEKSSAFEENLQKLKIRNSYYKNKRESFNRIDKNFQNINSLKQKKFSMDLSMSLNSFTNHAFKYVTKNANNSNKVNNNNIYNTPKNRRLNPQNTSNHNLILNDYQHKLNSDLIKKTIKPIMPSSNFILKRFFIKKRLFPYKYYCFSVFIKNLNISKGNSHFFSPRFSKIYTFLCQLIDITTYILLHREFTALKQIFNENNLNKIEKRKKINVNSKNCIKEITDNIDDKNFHILAQ
jgi:hypothetical protein